MKFVQFVAITIALCAAMPIAYANDSTTLANKISNLPGKFLQRVNTKSNDINRQIDKQTEKYLRRLSKQEDKLKKRLYKLDSNATKNLFLSNAQQQYVSYLQRLKTDSTYDPKKTTGQYLANSDTLQCTLSFINKNPQLFSGSNINPAQLQSSVAQFQQLQAKMQNADQISQYIKQRKEQIKQYLLQFSHLPSGIANIYNSYNKELYYYNQQISGYKEMMENPDRIFETVVGMLEKLPIFQTFIKNNSFFAVLIPPSNTYASAQAIAGLQTRDQISSVIQSQLSTSTAQSQFSQNVNDAQSQLGQLKDKVMSYGQGGSDMDISDFKPNQQKTKKLLSRIEYGANIQTQHSNYFYPTTTDIGLSLGYKINDKNTIGIGASYKLGWGKDIGHVKVTTQGLGLRSFTDVKLKGTIFISGGLEYNFQEIIYSLTQIPNLSSWQQSGLIGLSKIMSANTKIFKKMKVQLLWDFLSYQQIPRSQPFKFRVGYNF